MVIAATVIVAVILIASGCGGSGKGAPSPSARSEKVPPFAREPEPPPADPAEEGLLRLIPSRTEVRGWEEITFTVDGQPPVSSMKITGGVDSYLERWYGNSWVTEYLLLAAYGSNLPSAHPYPARVAIVDLNLGWPQRIRLPKNIQPGWYQIRKEISVYNGGASRSKKHTAYGRLRVLP